MKESRVLLLVWQLTLALFIAEVGYGMFAGSLGLISDGVHTAANCLGVGTSLFAVRWAKTITGRSYSLDLSARAEVLAAFTNSVLLLLLSAFLAFEATHQLVESAHHADHADHVAVVATAGIVVNFIGLRLITPLIGGWKMVFTRLTSQNEEAEGPRLLNLESVALHIVFDIVSSIGVITSTILSDQLGFKAADPLTAVLIAGLTIRGATPMFRRTAAILAQASTSKQSDLLLRDITSIDGVLEVYQSHFWSLAPSKQVATIVLRIRSDVDQDEIMRRCHRVLSPHCSNFTVQLEKERAIQSLLVAPSSSVASIGNPHLLQRGNAAMAAPGVGLREAAHLL